MPDATYDSPDLTTFCGLDELGLVVVGQHLEPDRAVLACRVVETEFDRWCRRCGGQGVPRDSVVRSLAHEPLGWRATTLRSVSCGSSASMARSRAGSRPSRPVPASTRRSPSRW